MRILFAIALLAFAAMAVTSVMIVRHIRKIRRNHRPAAQPGGASAVDRAETGFSSIQEHRYRAEKADPMASTPRFPLSSQRSNGWSESALTELAAQAASVPPPVSNRTAAATKLHPELAYYNQDMGDLSDPRPAARNKLRQRNR